MVRARKCAQKAANAILCVTVCVQKMEPAAAKDAAGRWRRGRGDEVEKEEGGGGHALSVSFTGEKGEGGIARARAAAAFWARAGNHKRILGPVLRRKEEWVVKVTCPSTLSRRNVGRGGRVVAKKSKEQSVEIRAGLYVSLPS